MHNDGQVHLFDLATNKLERTLSFPRTSALAFSPHGDALAVGDYHGVVTLLDLRTGITRWRASPPSRYRPPWTAPVALLLGWTFVAWRIRKRQPIGDMPAGTADVRTG